MAAAGVYLLLGPENGTKDEFLIRLRKDILKETGEPPEEHRYYHFDADYADMVATLRNNGLFSKHRLAILSDAHEVKKAVDIDILKSYCQRPVDGATFVMMSDQYSIDKRLAGAIPRDSVRTFFELFENKKQSWIIDYFKKAGFTVEPEAVNLLLELVENDTRDFKRECERLCLFMKGTDIVTADNVDELIYHSKEESVFSLFDHVVAGDFPGSLEVLQSLGLSGNTDPAAILGGLAWQFRRLLSVKRLVENRHSYEEALRKSNIRGKKNGLTYTQACRRFSREELDSIIALIADYEADFRSGLADLQGTALELFLYDAVIKKGGSATALRSS
ncbi:MAG: DNA polymerase III subunit delta [Spirochaetales bacterium]|nr:DNA polymerase III subunit delta [Spirochaetales bacterium]